MKRRCVELKEVTKCISKLEADLKSERKEREQYEYNDEGEPHDDDDIDGYEHELAATTTYQYTTTMSTTHACQCYHACQPSSPHTCIHRLCVNAC